MIFYFADLEVSVFFLSDLYSCTFGIPILKVSVFLPVGNEPSASPRPELIPIKYWGQGPPPLGFIFGVLVGALTRVHMRVEARG